MAMEEGKRASENNEHDDHKWRERSWLYSFTWTDYSPHSDDEAEGNRLRNDLLVQHHARDV